MDLVAILSTESDQVKAYADPNNPVSVKRWGFPDDPGPAGVMIHHTANPTPYPLSSLAGERDGRVKCNIAPRENGDLYVITNFACNYSSGLGSGAVLADTRNDVAPAGMARDLGLRDDTNGNPWYINLEVSHPGDGSDIPREQWHAVVDACVAICNHFGWPADRIIGHAEWSGRKIDPRWDGQNAHENCNDIRSAVAEALDGEDPVDPPQPPPDEGIDMADLAQLGLGDGFRTYDEDRNTGTALPPDHEDREAVRVWQGICYANGEGPDATFDVDGEPDGLFGGHTYESTKAVQRKLGVADDGIVGPVTWEAALPVRG